MIYKEIICPICNGCGFISGSDDHSIWSEGCDNCNNNGSLVIPMTNGDIIRLCNNEQLLTVYYNLDKIAIYSSNNNKRLLNKNDPDDFLLWLNKDADDIDLRTIFDFINEKDFEHPYLAIAKIQEV